MNRVRGILIQLIVEAGIGLFLACLILYIVCVSTREATFVYQGF